LEKRILAIPLPRARRTHLPPPISPASTRTPGLMGIFSPRFLLSLVADYFKNRGGKKCVGKDVID
jgi:hypothetical protein